MTRVFDDNSERGPWSLTGNAGGSSVALFRHMSRSDIQKSPVTDKTKWRPPMSYFNEGYEHRVYRGSGKYTDGRVWSGVLSPNLVSDPILTLPAIPAGLRSRAEVGALLKLKDQDVNFGQGFGERAQTARLFGTNITRVARGFIALKHRNLDQLLLAFGVPHNSRRRYKDLMGHLSDGSVTLAQAWLELQYGWKPLLADLHGACLELDKTEESNHTAYRVTVKKRAMSYRVYDPGTNNGSWPGIKTKRRERMAVMVRLDYLPANIELARLNSLGLTNPLTIAWELMPWSFVVDWAIPLGNWINALDATLGYEFLGGSRTELRRIRDSRVHIGAVPNISVASSNFKGSTHVWDMRRSVYSSSPIPTRPGFKNPVSDMHVKNAIALLITAFRGGSSTKGQGF